MALPLSVAFALVVAAGTPVAAVAAVADGSIRSVAVEGRARIGDRGGCMTATLVNASAADIEKQSLLTVSAAEGSALTLAYAK